MCNFKFCASQPLQTALRTPESSHGDWMLAGLTPSHRPFSMHNCERLITVYDTLRENTFTIRSSIFPEYSPFPLFLCNSPVLYKHTISWDFIVPNCSILSTVSWWREWVYSAWQTCSRSHIFLDNGLRASQGVTEWTLILNLTVRTILSIPFHMAHSVYSTPFSFLLVSMVSVITFCESSIRESRVKKISVHCWK